MRAKMGLNFLICTIVRQFIVHTKTYIHIHT